jgi:hypothetical protein
LEIPALEVPETAQFKNASRSTSKIPGKIQAAIAARETLVTQPIENGKTTWYFTELQTSI